MNSTMVVPRGALAIGSASNKQKLTDAAHRVWQSVFARFASSSSDHSWKKENRSPKIAENASSKRNPRAVYDEVQRVLQKSRIEKRPLSSVESILSSSSAGRPIFKSDTSSPPLDSTDSTPENGPPITWEGPTTQLYTDLIETVVSDQRFRKEHTSKPVPAQEADPVIEWLRRDGALVSTELPSLKMALQRKSSKSELNSVENSGEDAATLNAEVLQQRQKFLSLSGFSDRQYRMAQAGLFQVANLCAKYASGPPAETVWSKLKEAGIMDKQLLQTLLHVAFTFSSGNRRKRALYGKYAGGSILDILERVSSDQDASDEEDITDVVDEIALYHDLNYEPTEQSLLVRSRLMIAQGKAQEAEELLNEHSSSTTLHLRAYAPVLRMHLEEGELGPALRVYKKMKDLSPVHLDADTYVSLLAGIAERGGFRTSAPAIDVVTSLGYNAASGPGLLDELVTEMKEDIIEISSATARRLFNAFAEGFPDSGLERLTSLAPLQMNGEAVDKEDQIVADLVPIDPYTGKCSRTGITLRLEQLSESQAASLKDGVMQLAKDRQNQFIDDLSKHKQVDRRGEAEYRLYSFFRWLDRREGDPFTVVIDGPNVAYYMQNFESGRFSYHQIQFVIDSLEKMGERPLVILPRKYTLDFFSVTVGSHSGTGAWKQRLTSAEKRIRTELMDSNKIAVVPSGFLDDYYWIMASVSQQTASRKGEDLSIPPDDPSGRWPGTRPVLITNDQMRDHKLGMLEPMIFRRWYSNYIVNYNFPAFVGGECSHPDIGFGAADFFSREIQCNRMEDGSGANIWHFPVSDKQDTWFCLCVRDGSR